MSIVNEIKDLDMYWNELLFNIGGNASEIMTLKKYDIMDFFNYVENKSKSWEKT